MGGFNYTDYYVSWDPISQSKTFEEMANGDGTYTIPVDQLDTMACTRVRIQLFDDGGHLIVGKDYTVPIMIDKPTATTADNEYFHSYARKDNPQEVCKKCDVIILGTGILTKAESSAQDVPQVNNVKVYPGGKLVIPEGTSYTVNTLALRRQDESVAKADIQGALTINAAGKNTYLDLRIDPTNWHYVALPYDCDMSDIVFTDGTAAVQNTDFFVKWYDGAERAASLSGGWKHVTSGVMKKGQGYIVGLAGSGNVKRELRFPMLNTVITEETTDKTVTGVYGHGCTNDELRPNHKGWNLIGHPYMVDYKLDFGDKLRTGELVPDPDEDGKWKINEGTEGLRYIVCPRNNGKSEYEQKPLASLGNDVMMPFTAYFVQIGGTDPTAEQAIEFHTSKRQSIIRRAPAEYEEDNHPVWCAVMLTNDKGEQDVTTLLVSDQFTTDYDMMDDLVKMRGTKYSSYTKPVIASRNDAGEMAFNALPDNSAKAGVPLNFYAAAQGQYTLALDGSYSLDEITDVQLFDSELSTWHNLMTENYTFNAQKGDNTTRFTLYVTVERKQPQTPTEAENIKDKLTLSTMDKTLLLSGLREDATIYVYDMSGKLIASDRHTSSGDKGVWRTTVSTQGVYFVRVMIGNEQQTLNTIVY